MQVVKNRLKNRILKQVVFTLLILLLMAGCTTSYPQQNTPGFDLDENAVLTAHENNIIRSRLDSLLFENFPVSSIGTGAGNRINISIRRADEEADETILEMRMFIADFIDGDSQLSAMDINMGVFVFETTGPILRIPLQEYEQEPIIFPVIPQARLGPFTIEDGRKIFDAWWGHWGQVKFVGEVIITENRIHDPRRNNFNDYIIEDFYEPIVAYVFEMRDLRAALSINYGVIFHYAPQWNGWSMSQHSIFYHDPAQNLPIMHITNITPYGLSFYFTNQTLMEFIYGEDYRLYVREGDMWRFINPSMFVRGIGYTIQPLSSTQQRDVNWAWLFGNEGLAAGEYKFTKGFIYLRSPGDFESFTATQRFIID